VGPPSPCGEPHRRRFGSPRARGSRGRRSRSSEGRWPARGRVHLSGLCREKDHRPSFSDPPWQVDAQPPRDQTAQAGSPDASKLYFEEPSLHEKIHRAAGNSQKLGDLSDPHRVGGGHQLAVHLVPFPPMLGAKVAAVCGARAAANAQPVGDKLDAPFDMFQGSSGDTHPRITPKDSTYVRDCKRRQAGPPARAIRTSQSCTIVADWPRRSTILPSNTIRGARSWCHPRRSAVAMMS